MKPPRHRSFLQTAIHIIAVLGRSSAVSNTFSGAETWRSRCGHGQALTYAARDVARLALTFARRVAAVAVLTGG